MMKRWNQQWLTKMGLMFALMAVMSSASVQAASVKWYNPLTWFGSSSSEATEAVTTTSSSASSATTTVAAPSVAAETPEMANKNGAVLFTEKGKIVIRFYEDEAPITVANFKKLASKDFYDAPGMKFHRVVEDFVVQTGDPTGTGYGGSEKTIPLEVKNKLTHDSIGVVAMARSALPNSASSQFYITLGKQASLDGKYAIFAEVIQGLDVLPTIKRGDRLYGVDLVNVDNIPEENRKDYGKTKSSWNPF